MEALVKMFSGLTVAKVKTAIIVLLVVAVAVAPMLLVPDDEPHTIE